MGSIDKILASWLEDVDHVHSVTVYVYVFIKIHICLQ